LALDDIARTLLMQYRMGGRDIKTPNYKKASCPITPQRVN